VEAGQKAAEVVTMDILGTLKAEFEHHLVAYRATDLLVQVFGDIGRPALAE
jgi:hypothetical protein